MTAVGLAEFRLSFIFGRTFLDAVSRNGTDDAGRFGFLRGRDSYAEWFEQLRARPVASAPSPGDLTPPWPAHAEQGFWRRYMQDEGGNDRSLRDVSGREAFKQLVPVRVAVPAKVKPPLEETLASTEALLWPWAVALAITLTHRRHLDSFDLVARASFELRDGTYELKAGPDGYKPVATSTSLPSLADAICDRLAAEAFCDLSGQSWAEEPLSLHSTIRATGDRTSFATSNEDVRRMLQAVTGFSPTWESDALVDLEQARVAGRSLRPPDHITFGIRRGRAIWAPAAFLSVKSVSTIGCQHRNLVMAGVQTESLLRFVNSTAARLKAGAELTSGHRWLAARAVGALTRLWAGQGSYRSGVIRDQVHRDPQRDDINVVRTEVDQPAIQYT